MAQPPPEITITPFYIALDICNECFDVTAFSEYARTANRKEIIILNAEDHLEQAKVSIKTPPSEISAHVARNLKVRIDSELQKALDAKKRLVAALEKQRQAIAHAQAKGKHARVPEPAPQEDPRFDGKIDVLFLITDFGFTPSQLSLLSELDIPISAFLALVPNGITVNRYEPPPREQQEGKTSGKSTSSGKSSGKRTDRRPEPIKIPGSALSSRNNPTVYPPARWDALRPGSAPSTPFREVIVGENQEATWVAIEKEVVKIIRAIEQFKSMPKKFITIPVRGIENETTDFMSYVSDHPGDYVNGLWHQLSLSGMETAPPKPPKATADEYNDLFDDFVCMSTRTAIAQPQESPREQYVDVSIPPALHQPLYELIKFKPHEDNAEMVEITAKFLTSPRNFNAYAGMKFDQLVTLMNKKYQLNLPTAFFDWQQWMLSCESATGGDVLLEALTEAGVYESVFDDTVGILWILAMMPIPRTTGTSTAKVTAPVTIEGISEWMDRLMDLPTPSGEKKQKLPSNPAVLMRQEASPGQLLKPLEERFDAAESVYRLPVEICECGAFQTPYFLDCGVHIEIDRDIISGQNQFGYSVSVQEAFRVESGHGSILLQPKKDLRIRYTADPFTVTISFEDRVMYYSGGDLVMKACDQSAVVVTKNGDLIQNRGGEPVVVHHDGTISHCKGESVERIDKDGITTVNGDIIDRPHSKTVDLNTGITSVIRPDDIEYKITKDGTRKIILEADTEVEQTETSVVIDVPRYPIITSKDSIISFRLDAFSITMDGNKVNVECTNFTATYTDENMRLQCKDCQMVLTSKSCEVNSGDQVLISTSDGIESMGTIFEPGNTKKRVETIDTSFGKIVGNKEQNPEPVIAARHKVFPPRFFGVRKDLSVIEFLRHDILPEMVEKKTSVEHPSGETVQLLTRHLPQEAPFVYLENEPQSKPARSALIKSVRPPKARPQRATKGKPVEVRLPPPASESIDAYLASVTAFSTLMNDTLATNQAKYLEEITPVPPPPPEVLKLPPQTPIPRLQTMQYDKYEGPVDPKNTNYWRSHESDFGFPLHEPRVLPRPLSPRTQLFDPPRFAKEDKHGPAPEHSRDTPSGASFITEPTVPMRYRDTPTDEWRTFLRTTVNGIDFGTVQADTESTASITITNAFRTPIHFAISQPDHEYLRTVTLPGVVYPGLKTTIKVALAKAPPQTIDTFVMFRCKFFEMEIPVTAKIV